MRLKHLPYGNKACSLCDLYQTEDIFHVVIQCPGKQLLRNEMYTEIASCANADSVMKEYALDTMSILVLNSRDRICLVGITGCRYAASTHH